MDNCNYMLVVPMYIGTENKKRKPYNYDEIFTIIMALEAVIAFRYTRSIF